MALPFIGLVIAGLRAAGTKALKQVATQALGEVMAGNMAKEGVAKSLQKLAARGITDSEAALINRLKTMPNSKILELTAREMGLPVGEVKKITKALKQTPKMLELAKADNFKKFVNRSIQKEIKSGKNKLLSELGLNPAFRIRDLVRKADEYTQGFNDVDDKGIKYRNINKLVKAELISTQLAFHRKINGVSSAENKHKINDVFDVEIMDLFDPGAKYTDANLAMLQSVHVRKLAQDMELASDGTDVALIEERPDEWTVYNKSWVDAYIAEVKADVAAALKT